MTSATRVVQSLKISSIDKSLDISVLLERVFCPSRCLEINQEAHFPLVTKRVMLELDLEGYENGQ
jgi:hypothetical protein